MKKQLIFILLFISYIIYSIIIYTKGTKEKVVVNAADYASIQKGKALFQQHNCISCHQLYGLGGYLGPELTTAYIDANRGENYMKAFLKAGGARMPNFHFIEKEIDNIISYLKYVDATATTYKTKE